MIKRKFNYKSNLAYYEIAEFMIKYINPNSIIVCIGTDKCVGDCLGPLVGTFLEEHNFPLPVYGTLKDPIHALNLDKKLEEINKLHPNACIIGIDACIPLARFIHAIIQFILERVLENHYLMLVLPQ